MRTARILPAVCLTALAATGVVAAGPSIGPAVPKLFTVEAAAAGGPATPLVSRSAVPDGIEEFLIHVDPEAIAANPPVWRIDLPDQPPLEAVRTRFVVYRPDWKSWSGTLRRAGTSDRGTGYIHLGYHGREMTGLIDFGGTRYRIVGGFQDRLHRLVRLSDDLSPPSCALDASAERVNPLRFDGEPESAAAAGSGQPKATPKSTSRLDLLAVYPRAFFYQGAAAEHDLATFIQDSVSIANDVFANSGVDAFYNLVGIVPLKESSQPANGLQDSLTWLNTDPAEMTSLRDAFGADIVALFIPFSWNNPDNCGMANLPQAGGGFYGGTGPFNQRAFSAHRAGCGQTDFTLAHEIGHNYGMYHGDQPVDPNAIFPNGRGYVFTDPKKNNATHATAMACHCTGCFCTNQCPLSAGAVCNRIPYFSDPTRTYQNGIPIGTTDRNNAAVARAQVATYAGFRNTSPYSPPGAAFTVSCSGRTCTFDGRSSTDNQGISSYWWDFGEPSSNSNTGSGPIASHSYSSGLTGSSFEVHLVVTNTVGQTNVTAGTAAIQPVYEGYHEVANCRSISGWAWDQSNPNGAINVDVYSGFTLTATVPAAYFRQDLRDAGKGNGYHAFGYTPDGSWKDGQWHAARVRFAGTTTDLTWSPINLICGVNCFTSQTPVDNLDTAGQVYTVATQFSASQNGYITSLRFYRAAGETGTNTGELWTDGGTQLAAVTFPASPASGWVQADLSPPVAITAGSLYRVSVNTNVRQAKTGCGIGGGITNQVLTAWQGFWIAGNGIFPTTNSCSNFFVDVSFDQ
jgi:hypothetical protein